MFSSHGLFIHLYINIYITRRTISNGTRRSTPGAGGGVYYGQDVDLDADPKATVLAVPVSGPGFGASRFSVIRVGESPGSLQQRLLTNMMVIGTCVEGADVLALMSVADGTPIIVDCGAPP